MLKTLFYDRYFLFIQNRWSGSHQAIQIVLWWRKKKSDNLYWSIENRLFLVYLSIYQGCLHRIEWMIHSVIIHAYHRHLFGDDLRESINILVGIDILSERPCVTHHILMSRKLNRRRTIGNENKRKVESNRGSKIRPPRYIGHSNGGKLQYRWYRRKMFLSQNSNNSCAGNPSRLPRYILIIMNHRKRKRLKSCLFCSLNETSTTSEPTNTDTTASSISASDDRMIIIHAKKVIDITGSSIQ